MSDKIVQEDAPARPKPSILLVPAYGGGNGSGHLKRSLEWLTALEGRAVLYAPDEKPASLAHKITGKKLPEEFLCRVPEKGGPWDLVVLDNKSTSLEQANYFLGIARVVAIDEGGPARAILPYLIDMLPALPEMGPANETDNGYLSLPARAERERSVAGKILVSFGGVDEAKLTETIGQILDDLHIPAERWEVVKGPLFKRTFAWPGVHILEAPRVVDIIGNYDVVFTHFGLTAYEAAAAGALPILLNPTAYHEKLAALAGFPSLGVMAPSREMIENLRRFLIQGKNTFPLKAIIRPKLDPVARLLSLTGEKGGCPSCVNASGRFGRILYRDREKSYARCPLCGLVYLESAVPIDVGYEEDYFFHDYKRQYGKTYLEDFDAIKAAGAIRSSRIKKLLKFKNMPNGASLLDLGCAYGPFLQAASDAGFSVTGVDASQEAVAYVKRLGFNALRARFPTENPLAGETFDAVSLWYVIEHFKRFHEAMEQISSLVKQGGILAFSTPKGDGLTAGMNPAKFYKESPADHYVIIEKRKIKRILARYGFAPVSIVVTGIHPERKNGSLKPNSTRCKWLKFWHKLMGIGDTFEVYARKL